jgi:hypothetical protein
VAVLDFTRVLCLCASSAMGSGISCRLRLQGAS